MNLFYILAPLSLALTINEVSTDPFTLNTLEGSYLGGTRLFFKGTFSNVQTSDFEIHVGELQCPIVHSLSAVSIIECETPPLPDLSLLEYSLSATYRTIPVTFGLNAQTSFVYSFDQTPVFVSGHPPEGIAGSSVSLKGHFASVDLRDAHVGKQMIKVASIDATSINAVFGEYPKPEAGVRLRFASGFATQSWVGEQFDLEGIPYNLRVLATIDALSSHTGSQEGGLEFEITGTALAGEETRVEINGKECELIHNSANSIRCLTPKVESNEFWEVYEGGAGLAYNKHLISPCSAATLDSPAVLSGLFIAPATGDYKFYASGSTTVRLSTDESETNLQTVLESSRSVHYFMEAEAESIDIRLEQGRRYAIEIAGAGEVSVGMEAPPGPVVPNKLPYVYKLGLETCQKTFKVRINEETTSALDIGVSSSDLESTLNEEILSLQDTAVVVSESSRVHYIWLPSALPIKPEISYTCDHVTMQAELVKEPGVRNFWWVIPSDFLRTKEESSQVRVWTDGLLAVCTGDCSYSVVEPPTITSVIQSGDSLELRGESLPIDLEALSIQTAEVECPIYYISPSIYKCHIQGGIAGTHTPRVSSKELGNYSVFGSVEFPLQINEVQPAVGSSNGGTQLSIRGSGFWPTMSDRQSVYIGDSKCEITYSSYSEIVCVTSSMTTNSMITVNVNSLSQQSALFEYDATLDPVIISVNPPYAGALTLTEMTLGGLNFGSSETQVSVKIGDRDCVITRMSETELVCTYLSGLKGTYNIVLTKESESIAVLSGYPVLLEVSSLSISVGSIYGGARVTVFGKGFTASHKVYINRDVECEAATLISADSIECRMPPLPSHLERGQAYEVSVKDLEFSDCTGSCTYKWDLEPRIDSIALDNRVVTLTGAFKLTSSTHVLFNGQEANLVAVADNEIQAELPRLSGSTLEIAVEIEDQGYAGVESSLFNPLDVTEVYPRTLSQGGQIVTVYGSGFTEETVLDFSGITCELRRLTNNHVQCELPPYAQDEEPKIFTAYPDCSNCTIQYTAAATPAIEGISGDLTLFGHFIASSQDQIEVTLNEYSCRVTDYSTTNLTCIPDCPAGTYQVSLRNLETGFAIETQEYTLTTQAISTGSVKSSYGGGNEFQLYGQGLHLNSTVRVCGVLSKVTQATGDSLTAETPALFTRFSVEEFQLSPTGDELQDFSVISSSSKTSGLAFDGNLDSMFVDSQASMPWIGLDSRQFHTLTTLQVYVTHYTDLKGAKVQGSSDGTEWMDLYEFTDPREGWNVWNPLHTTVFRYIRVAQPNGPGFSLNELSVDAFPILFHDTDHVSCPIEVSDDTQVLSAGTVLYSIDSTPVVRHATPARGTEGTLVVLEGERLSQGMTVRLGDSACQVLTEVDYEIICRAGASSAQATEVVVKVPEKGYALTGSVSFQYVEYWSSTISHQPGDSVHILVGQTVLLDITPARIDRLVIEGTLIVGDLPNLSIEANSVEVAGGQFLIGSASEPLMNDFSITLHSSDSFQSPYGTAFLLVYSGTLQIHAAQREPAWTTLAATAFAGDEYIQLQEEVSWEAGSQIIVPTTSFDPSESEVHTITDIVGSTVYLANPLKFTHIVYKGTFEETEVDLRGEVGLLQRNVHITGTSSNYGAQLLILDSDDSPSTVTMSHVEVTSVAEPVHYAAINAVLRNSASEFLVTGCSIHQTPARGIQFSGSGRASFQNNILYHTIGKGIAIEQGAQTLIEENLVVNTIGSWAFDTTDILAAAFWTSHPHNVWRSNRAVGSAAFGYVLSFDETTQSEPLGEFDGNTARSNQNNGLHISPAFLPVESASFTNVHAWHNGETGVYSAHTGFLEFSQLVLAGNGMAGIELVWTNYSQPFESVKVSNSVVIGTLDSSEHLETVGLITPKTDGLVVQDVLFCNFVDKMWPLSTTHFEQAPIFGGELTQLQNLRFFNSHRRIRWQGPFTSIYQLDDSFLTVHWPHLESTGCADNPDVNAMMCQSPVRRATVLSSQAGQLAVEGPAETSFIPHTDSGWVVPVMTEITYQLYWLNQEWTELEVELGSFAGEEAVVLNFNTTVQRSNYLVTRDGSAKHITRAFRKDDNAGTYRWGEGYFQVLLNGLPEPSLDNIAVTAVDCESPSCTSEELKTVKWSELFGNSLSLGDSVVIEADAEVVLDESPPVLSHIEVLGRLVFDPQTNVTLSCGSLFINEGSVLSGSAEEPLSSSVAHEIILGTHPSDFEFNGKTAESSLINTGILQLHGAPKKSWTRLYQNVHPGDACFYLGKVDWVQGDRIVLAPSGLDRSQNEEFAITSVSTPTELPTNSQGLNSNTDLYWASTEVSPSELSKVCVDQPAAYYHSGQDLVIDGQSIEFRTEVALLTRNLKLSGTNSCNLITEEGQTTISNTEISGCGGSETPAVAFRSVTMGEIISSVLRDQRGWGLHVIHSTGISLSETVVYDSVEHGIAIEHSSDCYVTENLVLLVESRAEVESTSGLVGCLDEDCHTIQLRNNQVVGSAFAGYSLSPVDCENTDFQKANAAHSCSVGFLVFAKELECGALEELTSIFNEVGVNMLSLPATTKITKVFLAENTVGLATRVNSASDYIDLSIADSIFIGVSEHSTDCEERVGLFLSTPDSESSLTSPVYAPQQNRYAKGRVTVEFTTFVNYLASEDCSRRSVGIALNPYATDFVLPHYFSHIQSVQTDLVIELLQPELDNILVHDTDGSLTGSQPSFIISNSPEIASSSACFYSEEIGGFQCIEEEGHSYGLIQITTSNSPENVTLTSFNSAIQTHSEGPFTSTLSQTTKTNEYFGLVFTGLYYNVSEGVLSEIYLQGGSPVILSFEASDIANFIAVANGAQLAPLDYSVGSPSHVTLDNPHGSLRWYHEAQVVETLAAPDSPLKIDQVMSAFIELRLDAEISAFLAQPSLQEETTAKLTDFLGIDSTRLRTVSLVQGSVIFNLFIGADSQKEPAQALKELEHLCEDLKDNSEDLEEILGVAILDINTEIIGETIEDVSTVSGRPNNYWLPFALAACGVALFVGGFVYYAVSRFRTPAQAPAKGIEGKQMEVIKQFAAAVPTDLEECVTPRSPRNTASLRQDTKKIVT